MCGVTVLLAGDFRQALPIIWWGTQADPVNESLKSSVLWQNVEKMTLRTNMRLHLGGDHSAQQFATLLLNIGDGKIEPNTSDGLILLHENLAAVVSSENNLTNSMFPHF